MRLSLMREKNPFVSLAKTAALALLLVLALFTFMKSIRLGCTLRAHAFRIQPCSSPFRRADASRLAPRLE